MSLIHIPCFAKENDTHQQEDYVVKLHYDNTVLWLTLSIFIFTFSEEKKLVGLNQILYFPLLPKQLNEQNIIKHLSEQA